METQRAIRTRDVQSLVEKGCQHSLGKLTAVAILLAVVCGSWVSPAYALRATSGPPENVLACFENTHGSMTAGSQSISLGQSVTLTWNVQVAKGCNLKFYVGNQLVESHGTLTVQPTANSIYNLRLVWTGQGENTIATVPITVELPPTVTINANNLTPLFLQALAKPYTTIIVENQVEMDLTGLEDITVAAGVTLQGGRTAREAGPLFSTTTRPHYLFEVHGDDVHITGVRIQGADMGIPDGDENDSAGIFSDSFVNLEIDHIEISGWCGSAIKIEDTYDHIDYALNPETVHIHDNYIHHNQHDSTLGYGVMVGQGAYALIERNVFDYNRHAISGDGSDGSGYRAYRNLVLQHGGFNRSLPWPIGTEYTHQFDMHGQDSGYLGLVDSYGGTAGHDMEIRYNSFWYTAGPAIKLRGTPQLHPHGAFVYHNVFAHANIDDAVQQTESGLEVGLDNLVGVDTSNEHGVCDFDGDGINDFFLATGQTWWYSSGGDKPWVYLNISTKRLSQVSLGYFDGDNRCDVSVDGTIYSGGTTQLKYAPTGTVAGGMTTIETGTISPRTTSPVETTITKVLAK